MPRTLQENILPAPSPLLQVTDNFAYIRNSMPSSVREMQLSPMEGQLLSWLVGITHAKSILEIGTGVGYSTAWLAQALPLEGKLISIEKSTEYYQQALINMKTAGLSHKVDFKNGAAEEVLATLLHPTFDVIFIDANKRSYPEYFIHADRLLKPGGLLIVDDILLYENSAPNPRTVKMAEAISRTHQMISNHPGYDPIVLPLYHGLLLAHKRDSKI